MSETTKVEKQDFEVPLSFKTRWETAYTRGEKRDLTFLKGSRPPTVQRSWRLVILSRSPLFTMNKYMGCHTMSQLCIICSH